jgi:hypothetical protein
MALGVLALTLLGLAAAQRPADPGLTWPVPNSSGVLPLGVSAAPGRSALTATEGWAWPAGPATILTAGQPLDG